MNTLLRRKEGGATGGARQAPPGGRSSQPYIPKKDLKVLFELFDAESVGTIDAFELRGAFRALGVAATGEQISQMLSAIGQSPTDGINFEEFCHLVESRLPQRDSPEAIRQTFELFAGDSGYIDFEQLKKVCTELPEPIPDNELQIMIAEADRNGDGRVDFEDFLAVMRRKYDPLASDSD